MINKKIEYIDNADRVEGERSFSLANRCYGLGGIMTKLDVTTRSSIVLSILVMDIARIAAHSLRKFLIVMFSRYIWQDCLLLYGQKARRFNGGLISRHYLVEKTPLKIWIRFEDGPASKRCLSSEEVESYEDISDMSKRISGTGNS